MFFSWPSSSSSIAEHHQSKSFSQFDAFSKSTILGQTLSWWTEPKDLMNLSSSSIHPFNRYNAFMVIPVSQVARHDTSSCNHSLRIACYIIKERLSSPSSSEREALLASRVVTFYYIFQPLQFNRSARDATKLLSLTLMPLQQPLLQAFAAV